MKKKKQTMDIREKILLLETLMIDIRSSWDIGKLKWYKDKRVWKCFQLISEFLIINGDVNHKDRQAVCDLERN